MMKCVTHQQAVKLLHNKFVVVLGDSIQRSVYKDLVLLLQKEKYLTTSQLRSKGEMSFEMDCLVEGGCLSSLHNGTEYREVRQYQSDHHLVRFYFVTRVFSSYMRSILNDFRHGLKPDVLIINSCVWDITRYDPRWTENYKENLHQFFDELNGVLPSETLVIWNVTMPLAEKIRGGFLVPEIEHKAAQLRFDVIEANFFSGTLADGYGLDVLDLHFEFRFSLQHRAKDGVHWNAIAHRRITSLLLQHMAEAWGVILPCPLNSVENKAVLQETDRKKKNPGIIPIITPLNYHHFPKNYFFDLVSTQYTEPPVKARGNSHYSRDFYSDTLPPQAYMSFEEPRQWPKHPQHRQQHNNNYTQRNRDTRYDVDYRQSVKYAPYEDRHQYVMKSRHNRQHHYAPYSYHRPRPYYEKYDYCYY